MSLKKYPKASILVLLLLIAIAYSYSWTYTAEGRLDYRAAVSLHALSFEQLIKPDPNSDFEFMMPVNMIYAFSAMMPKEEVSKTEDIVIPGEDFDIPARIYWPLAMDSLPEPPPVIVYYHGGGFVVGSVDLFDNLTRSLANATNMIVLSVDYRLAPAHPYPAAVNDSYNALLWTAENASKLGADPKTILVGGDSAGGNLAAVVSIKALHEAGPKIAAQLLYYPGTDLTDTDYASKSNFSDGYGLSTEAILAFHKAYIGHLSDFSDPYISPLYAESLAGLPPALVVTAGFDPLTDSAQAYAKRLEDEGNTVQLAHYPDMIHGFMSIELFSQQREALNATRDFLDSVLK